MTVGGNIFASAEPEPSNDEPDLYLNRSQIMLKPNFKTHTLILLFFICVLGTYIAQASTTTAPASANNDAFTHISSSLEEFRHMDGGRTLKAMMILFQLAVVLAVAKLGGALAERIRVPGVLGELAAGIVVGPFALGAHIPIPIHGHWIPLFPAPIGMEWPVSDEFWLIAQVASIILLFLAGLHTNLKQFLAYLGPASIVAVGGVVLPFFFGALATAYFATHVWNTPMSWYSPQPMFVGAIMVATSVGITARVLSDIKKLDTPEGVTILGAAVVDDVLGILVLAIVAAIAQAETKGGNVQVSGLLLITVKAVGFWLGLTFLGMVLANKIEWLFNRVQYAGARLGLAIALALLCAAIAEIFGLAFIIGAYSIGLALSKTKMAHQLIDDLTTINDFIVPIFFAAMGMLVNFKTMGQAVGFGIVICILAIIGKVVGCGLPSLFAGFNAKGAARIGIGMLPRGEVALILAGVGLAGGYITQSIFGVSIMMTLVTTILAPLLLVPAFTMKGSGIRREGAEPVPEAKPISFTATLGQGLSRVFTQCLLASAEQDGYAINYDDADDGIYLLRKDGKILSVRLEDATVSVHTESTHADELDRLVNQAENRIIQSVGGIKLKA